MSRIEYLLQQQFSDKTITNLFEYKRLYNLVRNEQVKLGYPSIESYLSTLGYDYKVNLESIQKIENDLISYLEIEYPDKIIVNISLDKIAYYKLRNLSELKGTTINEILSSLGYTLKKGYSSKVDVRTSYILMKMFNFTLEKIGDIFDVSRERVRQKLDGVDETVITSIAHVLTEDETSAIELMIEQIIFELVFSDFSVRILNDPKGNVGILIIGIEEVKLLLNYEINSTIFEQIKSKQMNIYDELDFFILKNCKSTYVLKREYILNSYLKKEIVKAARRHKITVEEYATLLGFSGIKTSKDLCDDDFYNFFEENLIDSKVYISSNPQNQWIRSYASRAGMGLDDFVSFFGYIKSGRDFNSEYEELKQKYKEDLAKYKIDGIGNEIYLPSDSIEYRRIHGLCHNRKLDFDAFIEELGFKRIRKLNEDGTQIIHKSEIYYKELLSRIGKKIATTVRETKNGVLTEYEAKARNRILVSELKSAYENKCQLCSNNSIPEIIKLDGIPYTEVHHIIPLSHDEYYEEESLDVIENMIVLCPHHHKYVHYNHGGEYRITKHDGHIYLTNNVDQIQVIKNNHL